MLDAQYEDVPASFDAPSLCGFTSDLVHDMLEAGLPHGPPDVGHAVSGAGGGSSGETSSRSKYAWPIGSSCPHVSA